MAEQIKKKILIVDDSEIDREVLKMMIETEYEVAEAFNGFDALEMLTDAEAAIDAIMLDVQMPGVDGFGVIRLMNVFGIQKPIVLITSEATKDNVSKAARMNVCSFISKPFHRELVLAKVNNLMSKTVASKLSGGGQSGGASSSEAVANSDETVELVHNLEDITKAYLKARKKKDEKYVRISELVRVLLSHYSRVDASAGLDDETIDLATKAAYFCDIGKMFLTDEMNEAEDPLKAGGWQDKMTFKAHTTNGANMIALNTSPGCQKFVEICYDMCLNHHERIDGKGYPRGLHEEELTHFAQFCGMAVEFEELVVKMVKEGKSVDDAFTEFERTTGNYKNKFWDSFMASHDRIAGVYKQL